MFTSTGLLDELEQLLKGVAMMKELTRRTRDYLVSFGECMSTRIFAAYLNKLGKKARQVCQIFDYVLRYMSYNLLFIIIGF
jgi:aspartokinase